MHDAEREDEAVDGVDDALVLATSDTFLTSLLLAGNVLVFVLMAVRGISIVNPSSDDLIRWGAYYGPRVTHGETWRLLTAAFVHIGIVHLLMNMVVLLIIGRFMERLFGHVAFFVLYILCALGGSVAGLIWHPGIVAAGASGAVFGLYGGLVGYLLVRRHSIARATVVGLFKAALYFVVINTAYSMTRHNIDEAAHAGGFVTGVFAGCALAAPIRGLTAGVRLWHSLAVAIAGVAIVGALTRRVPPMDDFFAEMTRLTAVERQSATAYADAEKKLRARAIEPGEFATLVETHVLPPWDEERERLARVKLDAVQRTIADNRVKEMTLQGDAWRLYATGVRTGDQNLLKQAREKEAEASAIARTMTGSGEERSVVATPPPRPTARRNNTAAEPPSPGQSDAPASGGAASRWKVEPYRVVMRPCGPRTSFKSIESPDRTAFDVINGTAIDLEVVWFSPDGTPKPHFALHPGFTMTQPTHTGQLWALATTNGSCIAAFSATREPGLIRVH